MSSPEELNSFLELLQNSNIWENEYLLKRNEYLKVSGSSDTNIYWVLEGCLHLFVVDDQEEHTIRFGYQNNLVAALDSFISGKPSDLYIQAIRKTKVIRARKSDFVQFLGADSKRLKWWNSMLEQLILQQMERERDLMISSPVSRYNRVLERSPNLFQEVPAKYIAMYLRMTPETLSRIQKS